MKKVFLLLIICFLHNANTLAGDTLKTKLPHFITLNAADGLVFPTNDFVAGDQKIPHYVSYAIKYGLAAKGDDWEDYAYGMPHMGIGLYFANFYRESDLGRPFSLYIFQGAQIKKFSRTLSLNYEWNLGGSFNWKYYDEFDNPSNIALGSSVNIHVGGNLFMKWRMSKKFDLHFGAGFTHFSNGASSLPNSGLNMANLFVELAYHINREDKEQHIASNYIPPKYKKHTAHDFMFLFSSRQARVDTLNTGLSSEYTGRKFKVIGISYSHMLSNTYRYKWGPSVEAFYDESSGITAWRQQHPESGKYSDRIKLGRLKDRFSVGISLKGEILMPAYSIFANMGYDIIHGNPKDKRFYQILGVKVYLKNNLFGTFGIRANNFGRAQYLYWNLGYTFNQYRKKENKQLSINKTI